MTETSISLSNKVLQQAKVIAKTYYIGKGFYKRNLFLTVIEALESNH